MVGRSRKQGTSKLWWALTLLVVPLLFGSPVQAQQESSSAQTTVQGQPDEIANSPSVDDSAAVQGTSSGLPIPAAVAIGDMPVHTIGGASLLDSTSRLRWGDLSVGTVSFLQAFENLQPNGGSGIGIGPLNNNISVLTTQIIYDRPFRRSRLALQYRPQVIVYNGVFQGNFLNQDAQLNTYFALSPRWMLGLQGAVVYLNSRNTFGGSLLDADTATGTTAQVNFLQGSGTYLSPTAGGSLSYLWGPRTRLLLEPSFTYNRVLGVTVTGGELSNRQYNLITSLSHDFSPRTSVGVYDRTQLITSAGLAGFGNTHYYTFGGSISQSIGDTWRLGGSFGAGLFDLNSSRLWTESINANLTKTFQRSSLALAYIRGDFLSGYVTNDLAQRVDLTYRTSLSRRLQLQVGTGYQHAMLAVSDPVGGEYGDVQISYALTPSLSMTASYVRKQQFGDDVQFFSGAVNLVMLGLSWDARAGAH